MVLWIVLCWCNFALNMCLLYIHLFLLFVSLFFSIITALEILAAYFVQIMSLLPKLPHQPQLLHTGSSLSHTQISAVWDTIGCCINLLIKLLNFLRLHCFYDLCFSSMLNHWSLFNMARCFVKWTFIFAVSHRYPG